MKMFLKKPLLILISLLAAGTGFVIACASWGFTYQDETNYTPELVADTNYRAFFYTNGDEEYYYPAYYNNNYHNRFNELAANEWFKWFGGKYTKETLSKLLFKNTSGYVDSLTQNETMRTAAGLEWKEKKINAFLKYLQLAKKAEEFALFPEDAWRYDTLKRKKSSPEFCEKVFAGYKSCKDKFLKERWWFQYVRSLYFSDKPELCVKAFDAGREKAAKTLMYYRSMAYAAGACMKTGEISKANYYYSLVFEAAPQLRTTVHFSFRPQEESDWQKTLAMCANNNEKITLWQMLGIKYKDEVRSMNEITQLDAKSVKNELLLSRAVNKLEVDYFSMGQTQFKHFDPKQGAIQSAKLMEAIRNALNKGAASPWKWQMSLAYVMLLNNAYDGAGENFGMALKSAGNDSMATAQIKMLDLMRKVAALKKIDAGSENALLADLDWFRLLPRNKKYAALRQTAAETWIRRAMADKYRAQRDSLKAEFFNTSSEFYANPKNLHAMQNVFEKSEHSPYELYCLRMYEFWPAELVELEAISLTYEDKIDEAIALMEKIEQKDALVLPSNPFNGGIKDCHDCDHRRKEKVTYTKLQLLKKMKEMKDKLSSDPYNNAMLLGNAFYSITWFGSSRMFFQNRIIGSEHGSPTAAPFSGMTEDMEMAKKYYKMALKAAVNDEQKAKCTYLLSKCERNETGSIPTQYFTELNDFSKTKFYSQVINECGWFSSTVKK